MAITQVNLANMVTGVLPVANGGTGSSNALVPSGTYMLFGQTSAPTGWTKITANNNAALRVVSGSASTGGTVDFTTAFASQAVSGTVGTSGSTTAVNNSYTPAGSVSTSVGSTTLSVSQIPSHTHKIQIPSYGGYVQSETSGGFGAIVNRGAVGSDNPSNGNNWNASTINQSTDGSHNHSGSSSFTGTAATITQTAHTHTGGTFTGTAINLAVKYVDVIMATKD